MIARWDGARAGALGTYAEALPSDQRDLLLATLVAEATGREWSAILALSLTTTMLDGRESIKLADEVEADAMVAKSKTKRCRRL